MPDRYRLIVEASPYGVLLVDARGVIVQANRPAERMFGYDENELIGQSVEVLVPSEARSGHQLLRHAYLDQPVSRAMGTGRELLGQRKNGARFPVEIGLTVLNDADDTFILASVSDITERRHLQEQLQSAQRMETVGQLAGGIAHDFNNILTVIIGSIELLRHETRESPIAREMADDIQHAAQRAASLTSQLLAFSRQQVIAPRLTNLHAVVGDTQKMLRRLIGEHITLHTSLDPAAPPVTIDPGRWSQVLINLAVNARDAMPRGGLLSIETQAIDAPDIDGRSPLAGTFVRLSVTDTGVGMPADVRAHIFEPFFTTKELGRGTGLGLSVVHGIVEQSGGHIEVDSEPEVGTTFRIYVPATPDVSASAQGTETSLTTAGSGTILLVEDEPAVRRIASEFLTRAGYDIITASDGHEALAIIATLTSPVSLLLTDVVMPGADGRHVAEAMRERFPQTPVLYTSGYTDDAVVRHGVMQAEVAFVAKPYTSRGLLEKVRETISSR